MRIGPSDLILISCADVPHSKFNLQEIEVRDWRDVVTKFAENRISLERIMPILDDLPLRDDVREFITDQALKNSQLRKEWYKGFFFINNLLNTEEIDHVFIKVSKYPWTLMSDVDILIPDKNRELELVKTLRKAGFRFFEFGWFTHHPLKCTAKTEKDALIAIDLYPEPLWLRRKVCDNALIQSRKLRSKIFDLPTYVPSPEDDLYLVATHAFSHLTIKFSEILHGLGMISSSFNWQHLVDISVKWRTLDAVYVYLRFLQRYSSYFHERDIIPQDVLNAFENHVICPMIFRQINRDCAGKLSFPIRIPGSTFMLSDIYHTRLLLRRPFGETIHDFLTSSKFAMEEALGELRG